MNLLEKTNPFHKGICTQLIVIGLLINTFSVAQEFTQITTGIVVNDGTEGSQSGSWGDYDNDGYLDLFVANATFSPDNFLYKNNRNGTFNKMDIINDGGASRRGAWGIITMMVISICMWPTLEIISYIKIWVTIPF